VTDSWTDQSGFPTREGDQPLIPSSGKISGRFRADSVGIVAVGLMKRRKFPDAAVYHRSHFRFILGKDIRFDGMDYLFRHIGKLGQNRRTAQDDNFVIAGNIPGGPDQMLKL